MIRTRNTSRHPLPGISSHRYNKHTHAQDTKSYELDGNNAQCKRYGEALDRLHMTTHQTSLSCIRCFGRVFVQNTPSFFLSVSRKQCDNAHLMSLCTPSLCSPSFLRVRCSVVCVVPATHFMTVTMWVRVMYRDTTSRTLPKIYLSGISKVEDGPNHGTGVFLKVR